MTRSSTVRILITLPPALKQYLADLKRLEHRSASGHIQYLLQQDRRCRVEDGWRPKDGWAYHDSPAYQQREAEDWKRFKKWSDQNTLKRAKQIEQARQTRKGKP
jgi:hypothetical protein